MNYRTLVALAATALLCACAKNPDSITPLAMPTNAYSGLTCDQLTSELARSRSELAAAEESQRQAVTGDAVGVFLIGVPMSSLTGGDKEGVVAQKKGEVIAIEAAQRNQSCI